MTTAIEYALMAGHAYRTTRDEINWISGPQGWSPFFPVPDPTTAPVFPITAGFEAISFQRGSEIVISYAGTATAIDWAANIGLSMGLGSEQLLQAAEYYLQVKAANPGADITLTGHSLGGGLASLIGVFFGVEATTFDQAPFAQTARFQAANLRTYLAGRLDANGNQLYSDAALASLTSYIALQQAEINLASIIPNTQLITNINVKGEVLSEAPVTIYDRIGAETDLDNSTQGVSGIDLHSQALLAAFLQSDQSATGSGNPQQTLSKVTFKLTDLLGMLFDKNLYYNDPNNKNNPQRNFLENLVRHEAGVQDSFTADAMLTRFTADLWKLAQDGGLTLADNNISRTLTAFAMQKYYEETATSPGYKQELFSAITGGIRFDLQDIAATPEQAKGYGLYFDDYLDSAFTAEERSLIGILLPVLRDWYVQAGTSGMTAADSRNRGAFMLGGNGTDTLTGGILDDLLIGNAGGDTLNGGSGADILLGGSGADTLKGGEGADTLLGGANNDTLDGGEGNDTLDGGEGNDTYAFSGSHGTDIVTDSDGSGSIQADGQTLTGGTQKLENIYQNETTGHTFVKLNGGSALAIVKEGGSGRIVVTNWSEAKSLGIGLQGNAPTAPAPTLSGDFRKKIDDHGTATADDDTYVMTDGNYTPDGDEAGALDLITGTAGKDVIYGLRGDDALSGLAGDDHIEGRDNVSANDTCWRIAA